MNTSRLASTTRQHNPEAVGRTQPAQAPAVRRVEALEAASNERERSLQQEVALIDQKAIGPYQGAERRRAEARALADELLEQRNVRQLVRAMDTRGRRPGQIDENI